MMFQLLHSDDDEIVVDCAWGVSYITDGDNYKIQAIIDQGELSCDPCLDLSCILFFFL
jgi:hypothetical protein